MMKGLFFKDYLLIKKYKYYFLSGLILVIVSNIVDWGWQEIFSADFLVLMILLIICNTITDDENVCPFLFSMPISRKMYVIEKYCLGLIMIMFSSLVLFIFNCLINYINNTLPFSTLIVDAAIDFLIIIFVLVMGFLFLLARNQRNERILVISLIALVIAIGLLIVQTVSIIILI